MRRLSLILLILVGGLASAAPAPYSSVHAETRLALMVHTGFGFPEENNLRGGFETGFGFIVPLAPRLSLAAEFLEWKDTAKQSAGKLYNGTLTLAPILASVHYEFYANRYFAAYGLAGAAYLVTSFRIGSYVSAPEVRIEQNVDRGVALFGGLGANLALATNLNFFFEMSYLRRSLPATTITHDQNSGDSETGIMANLRHVFMKIGAKLYF
jgi:hypothetical protein